MPRQLRSTYTSVGMRFLLSDNHTEETAEILYTLLNRQTSTSLPFSERLNQVVNWYIGKMGGGQRGADSGR